MNKYKQLRVLETSGRYRVVDGRIWHQVHGVWMEKSASVTGGYRQHILFNGRGWGKVVAYEHEVVWLYANNQYDHKMVVDHINKDRSDNRIENLRIVSKSDNKLHSPGSGCSGGRQLVHSGQVHKLLKAYCDGMNKSESARKAGIPRLVGLYHINRLIRFGDSTYLDKGITDHLLTLLPEKDRSWWDKGEDGWKEE